MTRRAFWVNGMSMSPTLLPGDAVIATPGKPELGDIVIREGVGPGLCIHRVVETRSDSLITRGDAEQQNDPPCPTSQIQGVVVAALRRDTWIPLHPRRARIRGLPRRLLGAWLAVVASTPLYADSIGAWLRRKMRFVDCAFGRGWIKAPPHATERAIEVQGWLGKHPSAYAQVWETASGCWEVRAFILRPWVRGRDMARLLARHAVQAAHRQGATRVSLDPIRRFL